MIEKNIKELKLVLPKISKPKGKYKSIVEFGDFLFISGQVPRINNKMMYPGIVGKDLSIAQAQECSRLCLLKSLSLLQNYLGSLNYLKKAIKITGYIRAAQNFTNLSKVADWASELLLEIMNDKGNHTRTAVGVSELPDNAAVEFEFIFVK